MEKKDVKPKRKSVELRSIGQCKLPKRLTKVSASYVLTLPEDVTIPARSRVRVPLHFTMKMPVGLEAKIEGLRENATFGIYGYGQKKEKKRYGLITLKKTVSGPMHFDADVLTSKVDTTYDQEIYVVVNNRDERFTIRRGTRIAQLTFYSTVVPFIVNAVDLVNDEEDPAEKGVHV